MITIYNVGNMPKNQVAFLNSPYSKASFAFSHPEKQGRKGRVYPVFMPFSGCPVRCIFCSQVVQTGTGERTISTILEGVEKDFAKRNEDSSAPLDLAFFGGTFTGLPMDDQLACLKLAQDWKDKGQILEVRCSTRPDFITRESLSNLKSYGLDMVELGIQSFDKKVLNKSFRGYQPEQAKYACELVKEAGLKLGIQLMQGLPGHSLEIAQSDIEKSLGFTPDCVRLYPCLVFKNTKLALSWGSGDYQPWKLEDTVEFLSWALLKYWEAEIPVIRMGVAPEPSARKDFLAGPFHPSLGNMVRGLALYKYIELIVKSVGYKGGAFALDVPNLYQGDFWGYKGALKKPYSDLGIVEVFWVNKEDFRLYKKA